MVFMGVRIGCARCHVHPEENWTLADNLGWAAFFARMSLKSTKEWMEQIVFSDPNKTLEDSKTGQVVQPKFLGGGVVDFGGAEKAAQEAETAAANARAAAGKAAAAQIAAQNSAAAKRQQANEAKKKLDDLVQKYPKPADQAPAGVKALMTAAATAHQAAKKAAQDAATAAVAAKAEADKAQAALMAAEKAALAKRALAINQRQEDPRTTICRLAHLSPQNPWFAKNIVNRIWFWLLGRGIVHEPDDFRSTNPPENPELLQYLEKELVSQQV